MSLTARHFAGLQESPLVITVNAVAADVLLMRMRPGEHPNKDELLGALLLAATMATSSHGVTVNGDELSGSNADDVERELLRVAALAIRCVEELDL